MEQTMHLVSSAYFSAYRAELQIDWSVISQKMKEKSSFTEEDFGYYLVASSLYSSKIEGNTLDVNSYFRNVEQAQSSRKKEVREVNCLIDAYQFAVAHPLTAAHFLEVHNIASQSLLPKRERGTLRKVQVGIRDAASMRPVYLAVEPEYVQQEFEKLFEDIASLLEIPMSEEEAFYYAAMLHLWLAKIHPFTDGNGRMARLLEKWFLATKLGAVAWSIPSEKYYWDNRPAYYTNISLGFNYYALHWERCLPFLRMLPSSLERAA